MIHATDYKTLDLLKSELRNDYPNLSEAELNQIDSNMDDLILSISRKIHADERTVAGVVREKLDYLHSKMI